MPFLLYVFLPVPIASLLLGIKILLFDNTDYSVIELPFYYTFIVGFGYLLMGIQSLLYAIVMSILISRVNKINQFICSATLGAFAGLSITTFIDGDLFEAMFFWGLVTGLLVQCIVNFATYSEGEKNTD